MIGAVGLKAAATPARALLSIGYGGTLTNDLFNYPLLEEGARRNAEAMCDVERRLGLEGRRLLEHAR